MASVKHHDLQKLILKVVFQGDLSQLPASFYLGLGTGLLPAESGALTDITEVTGPGYARAHLNRDAVDFPNLFISNGHWKIVSDIRRFEADGGGWTAADYAFLTDVAAGTTGRLFASATLDQPFLNVDGDTWDGAAEFLP